METFAANKSYFRKTFFWKDERRGFASAASRVNFINVLQAVYARADPKSAKKYSQVDSLFALLGSAHM